MNLASYASNPNLSKGRVFAEKQSAFRNDYQRDRDRIIHSASFRRLQYKTQVFVNHEGDMFRSRLTHSIEVSQIARGLARSLNCHEDLAEAISLAHDLGHTPFGHSGQDALNDCMRDFGGFEHNLQSLRVVDKLEKKYASFAGLNLTFEAREGILKHCSLRNAKKLGIVAERFINKSQPSMEAQIVNIADEIAYSHHDLDDGYRAGILNFELLKELNLFKEIYSELSEKYLEVKGEQLINEIIRRMMNLIISDLCEQTKKNLAKLNPASPDDVRASPAIVGFSHSMQENINLIKQFSRTYLYNHPRIQRMSSEAQKTIKALFHFFTTNYDKIPKTFSENDEDSLERVVSDYIAGMTDRFANQVYASI